jgi:hypothetical protein
MAAVSEAEYACRLRAFTGISDDADYSRDATGAIHALYEPCFLVGGVKADLGIAGEGCVGAVGREVAGGSASGISILRSGASEETGANDSGQRTNRASKQSRSGYAARR